MPNRIRDAYDKVQLASFAYQDTWPGQGHRFLHRYNDGLTQAMLLEGADGDTWDLVIRGTDTASDLLVTDLDGLFTLYRQGRAHTGFVAASRGLVDWMMTKNPNGRPVSITGHSLGGALALLVADAFSDRVESVTTFGGPRVFCVANAGSYNSRLGSRTYRWVNGADAVPRTPMGGPQWIGRAIRRFIPLPIESGYRHVGQLNYIDVNGRVHINPSCGFVYRDRLKCYWRDVGKLGLASIKMHKLNSPIGYTPRIEALAKGEELSL